MLKKLEWIAIMTLVFSVVWLSAIPSKQVGTTCSHPEIAGGAGTYGVPFVVSSAASRLRWGLKAIRAPEAWRITQGSEEVIVAIIDSGIDYTVPLLRDHMWKNPGEIPGNGIDDDKNGYVDDVHGWDFRDNDPDSLVGTPISYHGTFVAGLVAASVDAATGVGGVAPRVRIMDIRFLDSRGFFYKSDWWKLAQAIEYAVENGARIINLSLYARVDPPGFVCHAIRNATKRGVLVITIAGNEGSRVKAFGRLPDVVTVGAVDKHMSPAPFSSRGPEVDLAAPGVDVISIVPGGVPVSSSGTSFAAPHVAGTAALLWALDKRLSPEGVREILRSTARDVGSPGKDEATGFGLVDAAAAITYLAKK